jgi:hypothetical protein
MSFLCNIGMHSWGGCKCVRCEKTRIRENFKLNNSSGCLVIRFSDNIERNKGMKVLSNIVYEKHFEKRRGSGKGINYNRRGYVPGTYVIIIGCSYCHDTWHSEEYEILNKNKVKFNDIDFIDEYREIAEVTQRG